MHAWPAARHSLARHTLKRQMSHGPTPEQVYERSGLRALDERLAVLRPDIEQSPARIDAMHAAGEITAPAAAAFKREIAERREAKRNARFWTRVFWFVGVPLVGLTGMNAYYRERAHRQHLEENPYVPPDYPYMRIRTRKFPWGDGDHTLFHNPKVNGP